MKNEKEINDLIDLLRGIDDEPAWFLASAIAVLEWCLK